VGLHRWVAGTDRGAGRVPLLSSQSLQLTQVGQGGWWAYVKYCATLVQRLGVHRQRLVVVVWPGPGYIGTVVCAELQRLHRVGLAMCRALHEPAGTFDRENGGGFLTDHFPCATKVSGFAALYHIRTWFNCCWTAALSQACLPHSTGCSFQPYTRSPAAHTSLGCTTRTTRLCTMDGVSADKRLGLLWAHHLGFVSQV
jgi:hypothetical protein